MNAPIANHDAMAGFSARTGSAADELRRLRFNLNLSQLEFSTALGMSRDVFANRELGRSLWRPDELSAAKARLKLYLKSQYEKRLSLLRDDPPNEKGQR